MSRKSRTFRNVGNFDHSFFFGQNFFDNCGHIVKVSVNTCCHVTFFLFNKQNSSAGHYILKFTCWKFKIIMFSVKLFKLFFSNSSIDIFFSVIIIDKFVLNYLLCDLVIFFDNKKKSLSMHICIQICSIASDVITCEKFLL